MDDRDKASAFRRLIEPLDVAEFLDGVWERRSMAFPGSARRFSGFDLDFERFADALAALPPNSIRGNRVDADGTGYYFPIEAEDCRSGFDQGLTICATNLHLGVPELVDLATDTRRTLGLAGQVTVNAYLSPAGRGFGLHFDPQSVFIMQLEGEKHWIYGTEPATRFPPVGMDANPEEKRHRFRERYPNSPLADPQAGQWQQCLLRPGDVLYLPPGTWHQGTAGDYSLALTLTCRTRDFSSLLGPLMHHSLFSSDPWRRNLPSRLTAEGGPSREAFIAERIDEVRQWAATLSTAELARFWDEETRDEALPHL